MLKLRLSMGGTKKRPVYKIVVADSRFARDGRFIEKLGFFNPLLPKEKKERVGLESDRIKYWLGQGAKPTIRVARILGEKELIPAEESKEESDEETSLDEETTEDKAVEEKVTAEPSEDNTEETAESEQTEQKTE